MRKLNQLKGNKEKNRNTYKVRIQEEELILINKNRRLQNKAYCTDGDLYFVLSDFHRPFHNKVVWNKLMLLLKEKKPTGVVLNGDYLDMFTLGSYNAESLHNLRNITLEEEYDDGLKGIIEINNAVSKNCKKMYLWGNHEDRYFREIQKKDNSKYGNALKNPNEALKLKETGWEIKTNWKDDYFSIGDLDVTHGTFFSVHVAKKHLESHENNIMFGHCHRVQEFTLGNKSGYAIGWLGDPESKYFHYMPRLVRKNWRNAFSVVTVIDGVSYVQVIKINEDNTFYFNGKKY